MALPYRKMTDEEDKMRNVLPKGEYPFKVTSITRKPTESKKYEMLAIELEVYGENGRIIRMKDWIVFMDEMAWKFRHFSATCHLLEKYENDTIDAQDFLNKQGLVKLSVGEYEKDEEIYKTNRVVDYIKPGHGKAKQKIEASNDFINDEIPF